MFLKKKKYLGRRKLLGIEIGKKCVGGKVIGELDEDAIAIFGAVVSVRHVKMKG